ncbi:CDP-glycerol glycerophosphotransferase family protein [bacterium]|nr:CDP-glycerol glycerophosphotransferase family protein [bacterium]
MPKVLFYFHNAVHLPVLLPIFHELHADGGFEIAYTFPAYNRELQAGFQEDEESELRKLPVKQVKRPQDWNADITFAGDVIGSLLHGCGIVVNVGHGLLSKGIYYSNNRHINRENLCDLLCVPGPYQKERMLRSGKLFVPIHVTGYPKLDAIFSNRYPPQSEVKKLLRQDPAQKILLYAPTFNPELSSIPILWTRIRHLAKPGRTLIIKLHSATMPEYKRAFQMLAQQQDNILYVDKPDITPYLQASDVMLSDVSSAYMEFAALDKPVVLFYNPNLFEYAHYDRNDPEFAWRDIGIQTQTLEEVDSAIERSLVHPSEFSEQRSKYTEQLLSKRDGNSSSRVIEAAIDHFASRRRIVPVQKPEVTILLDVRGARIDRIKNRTSQLIDETGIKYELWFLANPEQRQQIESIISSLDIVSGSITLAELRKLPQNKFLAVLNIGTEGADRWLFRLLNHVRANDQVGAAFPLAFSASPVQDPITRLGVDQRVSWSQLDKSVRLAQAGNHLRLLSMPRTDCLISGKEFLPEVIEVLQHRESKFSSAFLKQSVLALDVVVKLPGVEISQLQHKDHLDDDELQNAEMRVRELADWIGVITGGGNGNGSSSSHRPNGVYSEEDRDQANGKQSIESHLRLAQHYLKRNNFELARKHINRAQKTDPDNRAVLDLENTLNKLRKQEQQSS